MNFQILVISHENDIRALYQMMFERKGYQVYVANNANEAQSILNSAPIDLVVASEQLPGMNGSTLCHHMRQNDNTAHIAFISLLDNPMAAYDVQSAGVDAYFTQPFNPQDIYRTVENILSARNG